MRTKLLLADDSITIQKVVGIIFASEDYELAIVDNGDAAVAKAREFIPDVLLVDAVMPGKSGYEVCEEIRRDPALAGTPILLLTGAFEQFDEGKARQSGADDFIAKPFESQHLIEKVTGLVELKAQRGAVPSPASTGASFGQITLPGKEEPYPAPPVAVLPQTPADVVPPISDEPPDFFSSGNEPLQSDRIETPAPAAPEFEFEMVEGTADDDLWGAFDLEDVSEGGEAGTEESSFAVETFAGGAEEVDEPFVFPEEESEAYPEQGGGPGELTPTWEPVEDSGFTFGEEAEPSPFEIAPDNQFGSFEEEPVPVLETGPIETGVYREETTGVESAGSIDIKTYTPPAEQEFDLQFAPEEEYVPASAALAPPPVPSAPPAPAVAAESVLSDDQLAALVSKISRDIIEKIAWEVVPDLAERIISEEIRKIKEGA